MGDPKCPEEDGSGCSSTRMHAPRNPPARTPGPASPQTAPDLCHPERRSLADHPGTSGGTGLLQIPPAALSASVIALQGEPPCQCNSCINARTDPKCPCVQIFRTSRYFVRNEVADRKG